MTTEIKYCDNDSCRFNKKHNCTHPGPIDIDESGSCITAEYQDDAESPQDIEPFDNPFQDSDDKEPWFRKI